MTWQMGRCPTSCKLRNSRPRRERHVVWSNLRYPRRGCSHQRSPTVDFALILTVQLGQDSSLHPRTPRLCGGRQHEWTA
eukprot:scaffold191914_cov32-Tisochrysis_lutea.AAC.4